MDMIPNIPRGLKGNDAIKRPQDASAIESVKWLMKEAFSTIQL